MPVQLDEDWDGKENSRADDWSIGAYLKVMSSGGYLPRMITYRAGTVVCSNDNHDPCQSFVRCEMRLLSLVRPGSTEYRVRMLDSVRLTDSSVFKDSTYHIVLYWMTYFLGGTECRFIYQEGNGP